MKGVLIGLTLSAVLLFPAPKLTLAATMVMYGGNGGHTNGDSINDGSLVIVDQNNGNVTLVGHPQDVARLTGIAFASPNLLYGTTSSSGGFPPPQPVVLTSALVLINPDTGALVSNIGTIKDATGTELSIADLALQPGTGVLFGVRAPNDTGGVGGLLYTIDPITGKATFVGDTGAFFASIAFGPNGTLYESSADLNTTGSGPDHIHIALRVLNPADGAVLSSVSTDQFYGALGVRPSDGVIFAGTGDQSQIFTLDPTTGAETLVGNTGQNFVGDFDFRPVPEPATFLLLATGCAGLLGYRALSSPRSPRRLG